MADFQANLEAFEALGVPVAAASAETEEEAANTVSELGLRYPVGWGLNPADFAETHRAYYSDDGTYLHATGFLLDPNGKVDIAVYSSGAIGRLTATDSLSILDYRLKE